jgi:hypothetical protein
MLFGALQQGALLSKDEQVRGEIQMIPESAYKSLGSKN